MEQDLAKKARFHLWAGLIVFLVVTTAILAALFLTGTDTFSIKNSISYYVSTNFASSIIFLLTNLFVGYEIIKTHSLVSHYAFRDKRFAKFYRVIGAVIVFALIALSVFPLRLFAADPNLEFVAALHKTSSRLMFVLMAFESVFMITKYKKQRIVSVPNFIFAVYALFCVISCLFFPAFFWEVDFVLETAYIIGYFFALYTQTKVAI